MKTSKYDFRLSTTKDGKKYFHHNVAGTTLKNQICDCCGKKSKQVTKTFRVTERDEYHEQVGASWECDVCLKLSQEEYENQLRKTIEREKKSKGIIKNE